MSSIPATHVIQVTNVAPAATLEQMKELFGYLGRIRDIKLYPSENYIIEPQSRVCYVEYYEKWSVGVAQHLTNTVFIDRALIVVPIADEGIPSESTALALTNPSSALPGLVSSGPNALINEISGVDGSLVITTIDPKLTALGLPQYPPLPANLDPVKIEEIRRTVTIGNLDPLVSAESLLKFVNQIGEVKFLRMNGDGIQTTKFAFVEFTDQSSIPKVLQYNGVAFEGRPLIINHSTNAIIKPLPKSSETAQKEIEEAMKRVREAQSLITAAVEPELPEKERKRSRRSRSKSKSRRHSRSRSRHRSSSRSRRKRSRSRSKRSRSRRRSPRTRRQSRTPSRHSKQKSRSKSRERKKETTSPRHKKERSRSRSRDRKKEVSSPRLKKERSRSRSRDRKKTVPSPHHKREKSRSHSRDRSKRHGSKSHSPSKSSSKSKLSRKSKRSKEKVERSREQERSPKEEKSVRKDSSDEMRSESYDHKESSQSNELYGPSLPVPELNSSLPEDSKSHEQKFDSDMSFSSASLNTESLETSQNTTSDTAFKEHPFVKGVSEIDVDGRYKNSLKYLNSDYDNVALGTSNTTQKIISSDNAGAVLNKGVKSAPNMYFNMARNDIFETVDRFHPNDSDTGNYEETHVYGTSLRQTTNPVISENESTQNEDFSTKFISNQRFTNDSINKSNTCDISPSLANSSIQSVPEVPQSISVISTFGLPCSRAENDSSIFPVTYNCRETTNSAKPSNRSDKQQSSRSCSRSPTVVKRNIYKRTRSRSLSKESSYSRKNKSRSVSKDRSRSRSLRRSRSRSKGSIKKTHSPSRHRRARNRSRSHSSKRESYSPGRQSDSRRRKSSKRHSISSRKRSLTPKRKSRTPRRHSPTPHQRSKSPKRRSRSRSYHRSRSPRSSRTRNSPGRSYRANSKIPRKHSSSPSPANIRVEQRKSKRDNSRDKESRPNPSFHTDGANIDSKVTRNYDEEDYNLEKMMQQKESDNIEYFPVKIENNYNCGYNSADMDLGSD